VGRLASEREPAEKTVEQLHLTENCINLPRQEIRAAGHHEPWTKTCCDYPALSVPFAGSLIGNLREDRGVLTRPKLLNTHFNALFTSLNFIVFGIYR
jgi:hypothetical protein